MQLRTNAGRNRLNVLGAYSPDDQSLISWEGRESCDAERVAQLLQKIRAANPGRRLLVVLDNAPYNKAAPVTEAAQTLRIELLYLPPYSPDFNPIEQVFAKLKQLVRGAKERIVDGLWKLPFRAKTVAGRGAD